MNNLCSYSDVQYAVLYRHKTRQDTCVVYSIQGNADYFCNESSAKIVCDVLSLFDGTNTVDEVKKCISQKYPTINAESLINKIEKSKFIIGNSSSSLSNELERTSLNIIKIDISKIGNVKRSVTNVLYKAFYFSFWLSVAFVLFWLFSGKLRINNYFEYALNTSYSKELFYMMIFQFPFLVLHEFAHILTSLYYNLVPSTLGFSLHYNLIPMYYVLTPGMYSIGSKNRMKYHLAGVMFNFIAFTLFTWLASSCHNNFLYVIAFSNLQLMLLNLMPFNLSDGYFSMCILLKKVNLRLDFLDILTFRKSFTDGDISVKIYFIISFFYIVLVAINFSFWIQNIINDLFNCRISSLILTVIIALINVLFIIFSMNYQTKKLS